MRLITSFVVALSLTGVATAGSCRPVLGGTHAPFHAPYVAPVAKKIVVAEVIAVPVLSFGVVAYGGAYVPPVVNAAPAPPAEDLRQRQSDLQQILTAIKQVDANTRSIDERVKVLEAKVNGLPQPQPVQPKQPDGGTPPLVPKSPLPGATSNLETPSESSVLTISDHAPGRAVFSKYCAACHKAGEASVVVGKNGETKGGDFVMFDNDLLRKQTDRKWRRVLVKMTTQKMPPEKDAAGKPLPQPTPEEYAEVVKFIDTLK